MRTDDTSSMLAFTGSRHALSSNDDHANDDVLLWCININIIN